MSAERPAPQDPRPAPWAMLTLVALGLALLAWRLADLLILTFGGVVAAVALRALADRIERHARVPRRWSVMVALGLLLVLAAAVIWLVGDPLAQQLERLRERLPAALGALTKWLQSHRAGVAALETWEEIKDGGVPWSRVVGFAGFTLGALGSTALILFMGIYLAVAPDLYRNGFLRLLPVRYRSRVDEALQASADGLRRWLLGQAVSMVFVGTATSLGLWWLGIPVAFAVGLITGLLGFIPFFGAIAGALLAMLIAFMEGPHAAMTVLVLFIVIQQVEGHVLIPLVQKWAVELPPVLTILAGVVFGILFGLVGVLFATPLMVVVMILVRRLYVEGYLERA